MSLSCIGLCFFLMVSSSTTTALVQPMTRLVWHRRDLRLSDNELYHNARKIYSVFIFDPKDYSPRSTFMLNKKGDQFQSVNHGPHFSRQLIDAARSLRTNLQSLGGDLIVRTGNPLQIIPQLAYELKIEQVVWSEIPGHYECIESNKLKQILQFGGPQKCNVFTTCSLTLVHPNDLPTDPAVWKKLARPNEKQKKRKGNTGKNKTTASTTCSCDSTPSNLVDVLPSRFHGMPSIMGDFRRVARTAVPRNVFCYPASECIAKDFAHVDAGNIPSLDELTKPLLESNTPLLSCLPKSLVVTLIQSANAIPHNTQNLEEQSMKHLEDFVTKHAATAERSLCDVSNHNSSKLSLPLALGVLSPRQVYHCVRDEQRRLEQEGTQDINWLISHVEMRDYFLFNHFRLGTSAYSLNPIKPVHKPDTPREWLPLPENKEKLIRWASGKTGLPLVDAGMKELSATGYTSNRVRQNMASVLTKDLKLDWRLGAEWFQLCLGDHCVAGELFLSLIMQVKYATSIFIHGCSYQFNATKQTMATGPTLLVWEEIPRAATSGQFLNL